MKLIAYIIASLSLCCLSAPNLVGAEIVYASDFDSLTIGQTQSPALASQDGWTAGLHVGASFGEIQAAVANGGNAIRQYVDISNTGAQQSIDYRGFGPRLTSLITEMTLTTDFYATSSDLSALNSYIAGAGVSDGNGFGNVLRFSIGSGNGQVKSNVGISVSIAKFNGIDNNEPVSLTVGQNLDWNAWHTISVTADLRKSEWTQLNVNGNSQDLVGIPLPRSFGSLNPYRPSTFDRLELQVVNAENFGFETSDSIYFDNLSLRITSVPEPNAFGFALILGGISPLVIRRGRNKLHL